VIEIYWRFQHLTDVYTGFRKRGRWLMHMSATGMKQDGCILHSLDAVTGPLFADSISLFSSCNCSCALKAFSTCQTARANSGSNSGTSSISAKSFPFFLESNIRSRDSSMPTSDCFGCRLRCVFSDSNSFLTLSMLASIPATAYSMSRTEDGDCRTRLLLRRTSICFEPDSAACCQYRSCR